MTPFGEHPGDRRLARYLTDLQVELRASVGADACDWNGDIRLMPVRTPRSDPESRLGFADWDGTMGLRADLLDARRGMSEDPGTPRPRDVLVLERNALHTVRHELVHYMRMDGHPYSEGERAYRMWVVRLLEEGVTEAVTQNHRRAGAAVAEANSPGLAALPDVRLYPEFTPAARGLARYVARLHRGRASAVLNDLARHGPQGKYPSLARLILDAGGLWEQIPRSHRVACQQYVAQEVSKVAWGARGWARRDTKGLVGTQDPDGRSHVLGLKMVAAAERARFHVEHRYGATRPDTPPELAAARREDELARQAIRDVTTRASDVQDEARLWLQATTRQLDALRSSDGGTLPSHAHDRDEPAIEPPAVSLRHADVTRTSKRRPRPSGPPTRRLPRGRTERDLGR